VERQIGAAWFYSEAVRPFVARCIRQFEEWMARCAVWRRGRDRRRLVRALGRSRTVLMVSRQTMVRSPQMAELVAMSDVILVTDVPELISVRRRFPAARSRTFLLSCLAGDAPLRAA